VSPAGLRQAKVAVRAERDVQSPHPPRHSRLPLLMARAELTNPPNESLPGSASEGHGKWLALAAALLGWMFDGAEMGIFSMVGRPAVKDLLGTSAASGIGLWFWRTHSG